MRHREDIVRGPVAIEVRDVHKTFRVPEHRMDSFKERVTHPFTRAEYRQLRAVRGVSFDVHRGEFFGIVGRNGSGKSTLLKLMASIYRADAGRIRMAGRVAPFIELGVGFNPELTARENVVLNGVMMGLSRGEAARRLDAVLEFAELEEFVELKLKNYSSGMLVRLAFAVMVQADADVMLIDEVLAVGDAAFAQKCMDVFTERRAAGTTIVLVTHDMSTVQDMCDRATLMHDGAVAYTGDPDEAALRYFRLNFSGEGGAPVADSPSGALPDVHVRLLSAGLYTPEGESVENVEQGRPFVLDLLVDARRDLPAPTFGVQVVNADGTVVFGIRPPVVDGAGGASDLAEGQRVRVRGKVQNPLAPGRYFVHFYVHHQGGQGGAVQLLRPLDFVVYGTGNPAGGLVDVDTDVVAQAEAVE